MILFSRAPEADAAQEAFEERLIEALALSAREMVLVTPHLYYLDDEHLALERLRKAKTLTIGAYLYPRAATWTLRAFGVPAVTLITAMDLRDYATPEAAAARLVAMGGGAGTAALERMDDEAPRERWHPVLDYERCVQCGQCREFCLFGVFGSDENGGVIVAHPENCKPGCPACARLCPRGAILFPHCLTDDGIAGKDGAEIQRGNVTEARSFAKKNIEAHHAREKSSDEKKSDGASDPLDNLIDRLEELDL